MMRHVILLTLLITAIYSACFFDKEKCDDKYGCSYGCYKVSSKRPVVMCKIDTFIPHTQVVLLLYNRYTSTVGGELLSKTCDNM